MYSVCTDRTSPSTLVPNPSKIEILDATAKGYVLLYGSERMNANLRYMYVQAEGIHRKRKKVGGEAREEESCVMDDPRHYQANELYDWRTLVDR